MILSFGDFLSNNPVIVIIVILGAILGIAYTLKKKVFGKYHDDDIEQTPEEILQEELDTLLVTERYVPNANTKPKDILDEDDDDEIVEPVTPEVTQPVDDFQINTDTNYSFPSYDEENK